jgi:predicted permease
MDDLARDIRTALRALRRAPGFSAVVVIILGVGIGMAAAMATVFQAVLVDRLPVRDQDRLFVLWTYNDPAVELSPGRAVYDAFKAETRTLSGVAGYLHWGSAPGPLGVGDRTVVVNRTAVTGNFFDVLGARPVLGRLLGPEDEGKGAAPAMVISWGTWQRVFGGDPNVVGREVVEPYEPKRYRVVGVAPPGLDFPGGVGYWVPLPAGETQLMLVGRLAPNATPNAARQELAGVAMRVSPDWHFTGANAFPIAHDVVGGVRPVLAVLTAAVALLLLIVCVNVGNLLLLRATRRERELAVRRALGASFGAIVRQLLTEATVLAAAGGAAGVACGALLLQLLLRFAPDRLPRADVIGLAGAPVALAFAVAVMALVLFGVGPAWITARGRGPMSLRLDARSGAETVRRRTLRQSLVAAQVALAVVMLAGAGLLGRSLARLERVDLGYRPDHLSILSVSFPFARYDTTSKILALGERLGERLRTAPGVTSLTPTFTPPYLGPNVMRGRWGAEGQSKDEADANPFIPFEAGGPDYFRTFGIPLLRGRGFLSTDTESAPKVVVVSRSVANRLWPGQDPIGKRIGGYGDPSSWMTVVGVAGEVRLRSVRDATEAVYFPWRQMFWQGSFAIRSSAELSALLPTLRGAVQEVDPDVRLWDAHTMDELLGAPLAQPRLGTFLLSAFGMVALFLAAIGLYGVMASAVREQTREIGVRMALGATPSRLRGDVLRRALVVTGVGVAAGVAAALASSRLLGALLYEVSATDPVAFGGACGVLFVVAAAAAYVPARRATRIDPAQSLRAEA